MIVATPSLLPTFQFVQAIREQMYESRDMTNIPVIVVANKMDLAATTKIQHNGVKSFLNEISYFHLPAIFRDVFETFTLKISIKHLVVSEKKSCGHYLPYW